MKIDKERNIITFDTDDEFTDYCMSSSPVSYYNETADMYYYDYPFTDEYINAVNAGTKFSIAAEDSKVVKRGAVCRGLITKPVKNLRLY